MRGKDYNVGITETRIVKRLERKGSATQKGQHPDYMVRNLTAVKCQNSSIKLMTKRCC